MKFILLIALCALQAWGYPNFISKGYKNCLTCHYNPYGNGPLNDYGRAVAASAIADRLFISDSTTDEELADRSGFLFSTPKNNWFRPSLDYRGLYLARGINTYDSLSEAFDDAEVVHMQMDANITLKFGKRDNFIISGTYGVIPNNNSLSQEDEPEWLSREHYIGYRPMKELGLYAGKMEKIYGIRVPDHIAFSKILTNTGLQAPTHGLTVHWLEKNYELGGQIFDGDKEKPVEEQTKGFVGRAEFDVTDNIRLGANYMRDEAETTTKYMKAFLAKMKVGKASSVLLEAGEVDNEPEAADTSTSRYVFLQNHLYLKRGLYFMTTFEYANFNVDEENEMIRITPGVQYFPWQRVEVRAELQNARLYSEDTVQEDTWSFLGQLHLWF